MKLDFDGEYVANHAFKGGEGVMLCDGKTEILRAGDSHYCAEGSEHSFANRADEPLTFFAVVPAFD